MRRGALAQYDRLGATSRYVTANHATTPSASSTSTPPATRHPLEPPAGYNPAGGSSRVGGRVARQYDRLGATRR